MTETGDQTAAKKRLVVLISGGGSNLQSLIDACSKGQLDAEIVAVISNNPDAGGLNRAAAATIPNLLIDHRSFADRDTFDRALGELIESFAPDLVILAGFMRILTAEFVERFVGRLVNIHPSLLPAYPGLHTHRRAIEAGDSIAGATVHFVTAELDGGPAIIQARVAIAAEESEQSLAAKVLQFEHQIYPRAVSWFCGGRLRMEAGVALLDNQPLPDTGIIFNPSAEP